MKNNKIGCKKVLGASIKKYVDKLNDSSTAAEVSTTLKKAKEDFLKKSSNKETAEIFDKTLKEFVHAAPAHKPAEKLCDMFLDSFYDALRKNNI